MYLSARADSNHSSAAGIQRRTELARTHPDGIPSARSPTGYLFVQRCATGFKACITSECTKTCQSVSLGVFASAEDAATAVASYLRGEIPPPSHTPPEPMHVRARQLGEQLPPTPELVAKHCQRSVNDEGEKEGWCMPWDEAPGLDDARVPELRNILKAHNKACAQKVRRAEILQDQNWHNEVKAADRERKRQKRAMKQKEKQ